MDNVVATINQLLIIANRVKKTIDVQQSARKQFQISLNHLED